MKLRSHLTSLRPLAAALSLALASGFTVADAAARVDFGPALARDFVPTAAVTNCDDAGPGSLREAYAGAANGDVIDLTGLTCSTITLTTGALIDSPLAENVTIVGPGKDLLTIDGSHANRVLVHNGEQLLGLAGLTIANGSYLGYYGGGCIYAYGDVALENAVVTGCTLLATNSDNAYGGAIYAHGSVQAVYSAITDSSATSPHGNSGGGAVWSRSVRILASTISGNTATGDGAHHARGGGVAVATDVEIGYSLFAGNTAGRGGGLYIFGASDNLFVFDSTFSGNHALSIAGGIYAKERPLRIANSTITLNTAWFDFGAGVYLGADADIQSTIIAGNTSSNGSPPSDLGGNDGVVTVTGANNLVMDSTLALPAGTITTDPLLGPLQDNGGRTWTHALLPGSPAIDHGNNINGFDIDQRVYDETVTQRGYERRAGAATDIGAFESGSPDTIFYDGFDDEAAFGPAN